jgi:hypothetical protein
VLRNIHPGDRVPGKLAPPNLHTACPSPQKNAGANAAPAVRVQRKELFLNLSASAPRSSSA